MSCEKVNDAELRKAVDDVFQKYDINSDSKLSDVELVALFNDTLDILKKQRSVTTA